MSFTFLNTGAFEYGTNQVAANYGAIGLYAESQIPRVGLWDTNPLPLVSGVSPDNLFSLNPKLLDSVASLLSAIQLPKRWAANLSYTKIVLRSICALFVCLTLSFVAFDVIRCPACR
jgi:hypothetical protein